MIFGSARFAMGNACVSMSLRLIEFDTEKKKKDLNTKAKRVFFSKGNYILTMSKANACTMERD